MFLPDYKNLENAARNLPSARIPLYEHGIAPTFMERVTGRKFAHLQTGSHEEKQEFYRQYNGFQRDMGYDTVTFEGCVTSILPEGGALGGHKKGVIQTREDFEKYPWDSLCDRYFSTFSDHFKALRETMPEGMLAVGGVGNGVFECVQDLVGLQDLCYMKVDDEELYRDMFAKVGDMLVEIWKQFLAEFGDVYCVCRFGDDLGFRSSTLLHEDDVRELIIPQYKRIVDVVHAAGKPFLLHSCGCIFNVMDDIISVAGIDAKHSNEDAIAPYQAWIDRYGDRIGNFGGLDTDALCDVNPCDIEDYTIKVYRVCEAKGHGIAIGSGNSIPDYVSEERYLKANRLLRRLRGE
ncbi:MAG TPA: hypothetical protein H9674_04665 [Firmicutes bacterium]|nr:hypothetical protein [Bacillota bacterium]